MTEHNALADRAEAATGPACIPTAEQVEALERAAKRLLDVCLYLDAIEDLPLQFDGADMDALAEALEWRFPEIWTDEQVAALNAFQEGYGHAFTCGSGNRGDAIHTAYAEEYGEDLGQLYATRKGWICPCCDYRQFTAHDFMFKGAQQNPFPLRAQGEG